MITIIGGSGQVGGKVARLLLAQGCRIRVIARRAAGLASLVRDGAESVCGDVGDSDFLKQALADTTGLFFSVPPAFTASDMIAEQNALAEAMTAVVRQSAIPKIVNMSSVGADLPSGTGPIVVLNRQEQRLNELKGADVVHLRAAWFMENLLYRIGGIKAAGKLMYMIKPDVPMYAVATADIAAAAATALSELSFAGKSVRYLLGQRTLSFAQMASIIGSAIGKPDLAYEQVAAERIKQALMAHGYSRNGAEMFEQTANAFNNGVLQSTVARNIENTTATSLEAFASEVFAPAYFES